MEYVNAFMNSFNGTLQWTLDSILFQVPWYTNYFWGLIIISLVVWFLEIKFPWRKNQALFRKDFGLDIFYMFFNFFLFSIVISGVYTLFEIVFGYFAIKLQSLAVLNLKNLSGTLQLVLFFIVLDFVQWLTHIFLHKIPLFWRFHQVHHSVKEMGFAAHLRYHWMENILYKPFKTIGIMLLGGFEPDQAYIVHFIAISIGHLNHANINLTWGPLKYVLNNPVMHLYHHAYTLPQNKFGINFGISLSLWDYIFKTAHVPENSGTIPLGFPGDEVMPKHFFGQLLHGFIKRT